jgi:tetratricopeptide (TPR) repeat protein
MKTSRRRARWWSPSPGPCATLRNRSRPECAPSGPLTDYHLGVAQWHAGDRAQAVRSWERSVSAAPTAWSLRCLGFADAYDEATGLHPERAADRYLAALDLASGGELPALAALVREAVPVLLAAGRTAGAAEALDRLPSEYRDRGRFQLLRAQVLLAQGEREAARALFDAGFEVDDLREGDEVLGDTWAELSDDPLPARYDFRMRPA